ncbi:MAG: acetate uptake transporter [Propionibacteriaceae bacterium]|nr:acetate uptake transporter [Propionibacteriaceae bacterium]
MTQQATPAPTHAVETPAPPPAKPGDFIADPGALGTAAFALTTFVLSVFNAGLLPVSLEPVVFGLALFYGGIVQLVAGIMEFFKGSTFGAVVFCSYGGFWMSFWYYVTFIAHDLPEGTAHTATGLFLLAWGMFTLYLLIAASKVHPAMFITFVLLEITFILLTLGNLASMPLATRLGGFMGIITAFAAWYLSAASVLSSTFGRQVLPLGKK